MKSPNKFKHHLKRLFTNKMLKSLVKPFPRYGKAINAVVLLAFVMLVVAGAAALTVHNKPTPITTSPTSSTEGNNCLLSNSGCPDSDKPSTPTPTTQTPATTSTPTQPVTSSAGSSTSGSGSSESQQNSASDQALNSALQQLLPAVNCDSQDHQASEAANTYGSVLAQAQAAYNSEMSLWTIAQSYTPPTTNPPESVYLADAEADYNAIADPGWTTYNSTINSLIAQGCNDITPAGPEPVDLGSN
jgi:hypothetical protein